MRHQDFEIIYISGFTSKVKGSSAELACSVNIWVKFHNGPQLVRLAARSCMHQQIDTTIHYWLINRESMVNNCNYWLGVFLIHSLE